MRIIAGTLKGRRLDAPTWPGLRPTSDKLRETLFNVLQGRLPGARVLDVFAGTGAVGIEALSRGAAHVTFVEMDPRARGLIAENLARCGLLMTSMRGSGHRGVGQGDGYTIERGSAEDVLSRLEPVYDVVFLDSALRRARPRRGGHAGSRPARRGWHLRAGARLPARRAGGGRNPAGAPAGGGRQRARVLRRMTE